jgi:hypothetical protein
MYRVVAIIITDQFSACATFQSQMLHDATLNVAGPGVRVIRLVHIMGSQYTEQNSIYNYFGYNIYTMYDFYIVHATPLRNLSKILRYGYLYTQPSRKKLQETNLAIGEGDVSRKLCPHTTTLDEIKSSGCEESIGVYFRVYPTLESIPEPKRNQALIILHASILTHYKWHINYCENNGFIIQEGENAYFGDEDKVCPPSEIGHIDLSKIDTDDSEILVHSDVHLLRNNGKYIQNIKTKKIDEKTKKQLVKHSKWMKTFVSTTLKKTPSNTIKSASRRTKSKSKTRKNSKPSTL